MFIVDGFKFRSVEHTYTCGETFDNHGRIIKAWEFYKRDVEQAVKKTGVYSSIPNSIYPSGVLTKHHLYLNTSNSYFDQKTFDYRLKSEKRNFVNNIMVHWHRFAHIQRTVFYVER